MGPLDLTDEEIRELEDEDQRWLRESTALGPEEVGGSTVYWARLEGSGVYGCSKEHYRIICEYDAAKRRQGAAADACMAARGWARPAAPLAEEDEPAPEAVQREGKLTARQALFCENYLVQPVAARAAVLAGYSEDNATSQGSRLLKNPVVLARIAELRAERKFRYALDPDTLQDKLEAVFFDALEHLNHGAAVAALRLQAGLGRLPTRLAAAKPPVDAVEGAPAGGAPANGALTERAAANASPAPVRTAVAPRRKASKSRRIRRKKPAKANKSQRKPAL